MDHQRFVAEVSSRGGFERAQDAAQAVVATLRALGERLHEPDAEAVAHDLPPTLGRHLRRARFDGAFGVDDFYARVADYEQVQAGRALEHAQVVCQVLGETVTAGGWKHLHAHLPEEWTALFAPPADRRKRGAGPPLHPPPARKGTRQTLSSGRPGNKHTVGEPREL